MATKTKEIIRDQGLIDALQSQLNFERFSADVYYSLACQLDALNLTGMAAYMHKRAGEEREHAHKFSDYIADRYLTPVLSAIADPTKPIGADPMSAGMRAFSAALDHERIVTQRINTLYEMAHEAEDPATCVFLHWFIAEQVEEERTLDEIVTKFTLATGNGAAILMLDHELGD